MVEPIFVHGKCSEAVNGRCSGYEYAVCVRVEAALHCYRCFLRQIEWWPEVIYALHKQNHPNIIVNNGARCSRCDETIIQLWLLTEPYRTAA